MPGPGDPLPDQVQQFLDYLRVQRNRPLTTVRAYRYDLAKFVAFARVRSPGPVSARASTRPPSAATRSSWPRPSPTRAPGRGPWSRSASSSATRTTRAGPGPSCSRRVVVPRYIVGDPHPIATEVVPRLLAALPRDGLRDLRDRALVHFLISSGCRIGEACASTGATSGRTASGCSARAATTAPVFLTEDAWTAVRDYLLARGQDASPALFISVAHPDMPGGRVLPGNRLTTDGARRALTALRRRFAGDPDAFRLIEGLRSPHAARHTAATTLLEATDGDVRLVQEVLGHATLETLRVYTEITDRRKRAAYARLGDYLREVGEA